MSSASESGGPPWEAYNPDGSIHMGGVPERLLHHPEMQRRGIRLGYAMNPVRTAEIPWSAPSPESFVGFRLRFRPRGPTVRCQSARPRYGRTAYL